MMRTDQLIGVFALGFGVVTLVLRFVKPDALGKQKAMRAKFGDGPGTAIHVIAYTILPIVVGVALLAF